MIVSKILFQKYQEGLNVDGKKQDSRFEKLLWNLIKTTNITHCFASKRETASLIIALLLNNIYKNSDTFIPNFGGWV